MIIAIDFDGTIVKHAWPKIGKPVPGAIETMLDLQKAGHQLILWTVRGGRELRAAVDYCAEEGVIFWGVNENPTQKFWGPGPKAHADLFIDDAALGCPLIYGEKRPFVNWCAVRTVLRNRGAFDEGGD